MIKEILLNKPGKKVILLGNEAVIRGALEAGVQFVATYPGTPASEIGNLFYQIQNSESKIPSLYFEFSVNEKVAMEAGMGASYSGLRTLVAMKNFGLNVASDALLPFIYTGTKGPTVIFIADDPSCYSSAQSEENTRAFASLSHIPILEPSDPQECKDFVKLAYQLSAKFRIPVMIRTTTRVSHQRMSVKLGPLARNDPANGKFVKDPHQFITMPPRVLEMKDELLAKIAQIQVLGETGKGSAFFNAAKKSDIGIITSGISHLYAMEAMKELKISLPVLKINFFHPLPEKKIQAFIGKYKKILVAEELDPYLEKEVLRLAKDVNCKVQIIGKKLLPITGEMKPEFVISALAKITNKKYKIEAIKDPIFVPQRSPILCPGCPYWSVISAVKSSVDIKEVVFGGEIGCYMLFGNAAIGLQDYLSCMGSSVGIGHGIKKALQHGSGQASKQKLIAFVGDSSFFHAGIPALINTVFNKSNPLIVILNNETTAMTGNQPHPASVNVAEPLNIEAIVRACGVKYVKTIDPKNRDEFTQTVKEFLNKDEVSVIVAKHPCIFAVKK